VTGNTLDYTAHMYSSKEKTSARMRQAKKGRPSARRRIRHGAGCPPQPASRLAGAGSGAQRRCGVQAAGFRGCAPVDAEVKIPFDLPIRQALTPRSALPPVEGAWASLSSAVPTLRTAPAMRWHHRDCGRCANARPASLPGALPARAESTHNTLASRVAVLAGVLPRRS
jgi:hypothetical protein